jgi:L-threonylcarbamoyladenylate synthase
MLKTQIHHLDEDNFDVVVTKAASIIKSGGLVVFPTETVYGIGANALNPNASKNIYKVKGRPSDNPLILHISDKEDFKDYAIKSFEYIDILIEAFWPGPLTLVCPKTDLVPKTITGGLDTVAIRLPNNQLAQSIIRASKTPICAPSANISGSPSSTSFNHVYDDFNGFVEMIIDGGNTHVGLESTVLDCTKETPVILRPGSITKDMIESEIHIKLEKIENQKNSQVPKSPGMKYKHYAPKKKTVLLKGTRSEIASYVNQINEKRFGLIGTSELIQLIQNEHTYDLGPSNHYDLIASHIFNALRSIDKKEIDIIYIEVLEETGIGEAIMNRLLKAANNQIIDLTH